MQNEPRYSFMEILVPLAIAVAGIHMSARPSDSRPVEEDVPYAVDGSWEDDDPMDVPDLAYGTHEPTPAPGIGPDEGHTYTHTMPAFYDPDAPQQPAQPHNNMTPYFRSSSAPGTQTGQSSLSDFQLSLYTGSSNMPQWKGSSEVEPIFNPTREPSKEDIHVLARQRHDQYDNTKVVLNNMSPFQPEQVGPGLGLGYDVAVRDTGFQENLRILPGNADAYRRNTLEGRVKVGAPSTGKSASRPAAPIPQNDLSEGFARRGPGGGGVAPMRAATHRSAIVQRDVQDLSDNAYAGGSNGTVLAPTPGLGGTAAVDTRYATQRGAADASYAGLAGGDARGGFATAPRNVIDTNRGEEYGVLLGGSREGAQTVVPHADQGFFTTQRGRENERFEILGGSAQSQGSAAAYSTSFSQAASRRGVQESSWCGGVRGDIDAPTSRSATDDRNANRTELGRVGGGSASYEGSRYAFRAQEVQGQGQLPHAQEGTAFELSHKREDTLVGYTPGPMRRNDLADPRDRAGSFSLPVHQQNAFDTYVPTVHREIHGAERVGPVPGIKDGNRISSVNDRASAEFLGTAKDQLCSNPYHVSIH
jgi:hypothetical protein